MPGPCSKLGRAESMGFYPCGERRDQVSSKNMTTEAAATTAHSTCTCSSSVQLANRRPDVERMTASPGRKGFKQPGGRVAATTTLCGRQAMSSVSTILLILFFVASAVQSIPSFSSAASQMSPIENFGPSWSASSAHGTTIAVSCSLRIDDNESVVKTDAVVLLLRYNQPSPASPWASIRQGETTTDAANLQRSIDGLKITGPVHYSADDSFLSSNRAFLKTCGPKRWVFLGSTALCSMTGLASDIDYLTSSMQMLVEDHRYIYDGASAAKTSVLPIGQVLDLLASVLQKETVYEGQRPMGVQVLLVGRDPLKFGIVGASAAAGATTSPSAPSAFKMFTLDPSGGYRHWGVGAAIGRNAPLVRKQLYNHLRSKGDGEKAKTGVDILKACLRSSIEARREEATKSGELDQYEALLLWEEGDQLCVASVDANQVCELKDSIQADLKGGAAT